MESSKEIIKAHRRVESRYLNKWGGGEALHSCIDNVGCNLVLVIFILHHHRALVSSCIIIVAGSIVEQISRMQEVLLIRDFFVVGRGFSVRFSIHESLWVVVGAIGKKACRQ